MTKFEKVRFLFAGPVVGMEPLDHIPDRVLVSLRVMAEATMMATVFEYTMGDHRLRLCVPWEELEAAYYPRELLHQRLDCLSVKVDRFFLGNQLRCSAESRRFCPHAI